MVAHTLRIARYADRVMRTCIRCGQSRPVENFSITQRRCRACISEINREQYAAGASATRSYDGVFAANLRRNHGLTMADYEQMAVAQNGRCAICESPETALRRNGQPLRLAVDHNHRTGQVRQLLCRRCNQIMWTFEEHTALFEQLTAYMVRWQAASG